MTAKGTIVTLIASFVRHLENYRVDTGNSSFPGPSRSTIRPRDEFWVIFKMAEKLMKKRKRNQEIKVSLTGLSKFKEGVSNIQEMLSLRKRHQPSFARN